jgi:hypothetical protein
MKTLMLMLMTVLLSLSLHAAPVIYSLNFYDSGSGLSPATGPFGTVTVADLTNSNTATVTFSALPGFMFIDGNIVDVNVNGGTAAFTSGTTDIANGFTVGTISGPTSGIVNGFGTLNSTFTASDGFASAWNQIVLTLSKTTGVWGSASDVLAANSDGFFVAAHVAICNSGAPCIASSGSDSTGFVSVALPEPSTYLLLGSLLGMCFFMKRRVLACKKA